MGPSCLLHLPDGQAGGRAVSCEFPLSGQRCSQPSDRGCVDLPLDTGVLHCGCHLHGSREGRRRNPCRCRFTYPSDASDGQDLSCRLDTPGRPTRALGGVMKLMEVQQVIKPALRRTAGGAQPKPRGSILRRAWAATAEYLDHTFGWHRLPKYLGLAVLLGLRTTLRKENLYDTSHLPTHDAPEAPLAGHNAMHRSADGSWNDRKSAVMGMANTRF